MTNTVKATVQTAKDAGCKVGWVVSGKKPHAVVFNDERSDVETLCTGKPAMPDHGTADVTRELCGNCGKKLFVLLAAAAPVEEPPAEAPQPEAKPKRRRAAKKSAKPSTEAPTEQPAEKTDVPAEDAAPVDQPAEGDQDAPVTPEALRATYYEAKAGGVAENLAAFFPEVPDFELDSDGDPAEHVWVQMAEVINEKRSAERAAKAGDNLPVERTAETLPPVILASVSDPAPDSTETPLEGKVTTHVESYRSIKAVVALVADGAALAKRVVSASKKAEAGPKQLAIMQHKIKLEIPRDGDGWPDLKVQQQRTRDALAAMWDEAGLKVVKPKDGEEMDPASKAAHKVRGATRAHGNDVRVLYLRGVMDDEEQRVKFPGAESTEDLFKGYGIDNELTAEKRERQAAERAAKAAAPAESEAAEDDDQGDDVQSPAPATTPARRTLESVRTELSRIDLGSLNDQDPEADNLAELWKIRDMVQMMINVIAPPQDDE